MSSRTFLSILIIIALVILQTTLFRYLPFKGIVPDIAMLALIFISHRKGSITGQISGFSSGIIEDFLSLSPLGFHTLLKTVIGFLFGSTSGRMFIDPFFIPILFAILATLTKGILAAVVSFIFSIQLSIGSILSLSFLMELGLNALLSPLIFYLTGLLKFLYPVRREDTR